MSEISPYDDEELSKHGLRIRCRELRDRIAELEAECAAMREALGLANGLLKSYVRNSESDGAKALPVIRAALATNAGVALLERLRRAEDLADGDLVHARLAQMQERVQRAEASSLEGATGNVLVRHVREQQRLMDECAKLQERAEKAESQLAAIQAATPAQAVVLSLEEFHALKKAERIANAHRPSDEWDRLTRADALEEAAKVVEAAVGEDVGLQRLKIASSADIAAAIRALKGGGT